ncbi:inositol-pentakisphosphate 2-kinase [Absidia repens]|uniref:Inositol-pentakisphosphate 2-kinase n=1 Tax=Absidia repens TaxID=90262 RepID=A0A1X2I4E2_9FUNG|nr:inositol-pentakisphosphate 2-kinase [Absidia repens]
MIHLSCQHIHDWTYFTEGNAHVILKYSGNDPTLAGYVLRLTKNISDQQLPDGFHTDFRQHIITTLLGSKYLDHMIHVQVTPEFIKTINDKIHNDRPSKRRSVLIHPSSHASLMKNWTLYYAPEDTWTFELKPKWGFLPKSVHIDKKHQQLKRTKCRFCMHQRLRQQHDTTDNMKSSALHDYCPLDLYSDNPQRIRKALTSSLTQPHNYLKLFHNGQLVPHTHWRSTFPLLFNHQQQQQQQQYSGQTCAKISTTTVGMGHDHWINMMVDVLVKILTEDPILKILKRLQQSLDEYDVEGIYPLYQKYGQQPTHDINHWKYIVEQFMGRELQQNLNDGHKKNLDRDKGTGLKNMDDEKEELQRLYEYLISMTLKDCSVMICMTKGIRNRQGDTALPSTTSRAMVESSGHCFQYHIKVVDVDMKKWNKIPFWFDLDKRIIQYNLQQEQQQRHGQICLD